MPTENRSSNTEMISVPRELAENLASALYDHDTKGLTVQLQEWLAKPAEQHQGEPVALPSCNAKLSDSHDWDQGYRGGWRACLDEIAKLGPLYTRPAQGEPVGEVVAFGKGLHEIAWTAGRMPKLGAKLYTHADPGEVERLAILLRQTQVKHSQVVDGLRADSKWLRDELDKALLQMAERDALLADIKTKLNGQCWAWPGLIRRIDELSASAEPQVKS